MAEARNVRASESRKKSREAEARPVADGPEVGCYFDSG